METPFIQLLIFFLVAIFGHLAHILTKLVKLEKLKDFTLKVWIEKNMFNTILGLVSTVCGIFILYGMDQLNYATAILVGYTGDSLIKNAAAKFKQKIKSNDGDGK